MCYNAAHPNTWSNVFNIYNKDDIENRINQTYSNNYTGIPGRDSWFSDQEILYTKLIKYPNLQVLRRPINRLEVREFKNLLNSRTNFISNYDDVHFHRSYFNNEELINIAEKQL
jgi:hypothetical protein